MRFSCQYFIFVQQANIFDFLGVFRMCTFVSCIASDFITWIFEFLVYSLCSFDITYLSWIWTYTNPAHKTWKNEHMLNISNFSFEWLLRWMSFGCPFVEVKNKKENKLQEKVLIHFIFKRSPYCSTFHTKTMTSSSSTNASQQFSVDFQLRIT